MKDKKMADSFVPLVKSEPFPKTDDRLKRRGRNLNLEADSLLEDLIKLVKERPRKGRKSAKTEIDTLSKLNVEITKLTKEVKSLNTQLTSLKKL